MKVWITKYALTQGVFEAEVANFDPVRVQYCRLPAHPSAPLEWAESKEFHTSLGEALDRADDMREAKIKILKKQLRKLEEMKFKVEQ